MVTVGTAHWAWAAGERLVGRGVHKTQATLCYYLELAILKNNKGHTPLPHKQTAPTAGWA